MTYLPYKDLLAKTNLHKVSIGSTGINIYSEPELLPGQIGYSIGSDGESLAGQNEGDWKQEWLVIGHEDCCGDPIFVDLQSVAFPVYTALHGIGEWRANRIADSFEAFGKSLMIISDIAIGREDPVKLEKNPVNPVERKKALDNIKQLNPTSDIEFWELLLGHFED